MKMPPTVSQMFKFDLTLFEINHVSIALIIKSFILWGFVAIENRTFLFK